MAGKLIAKIARQWRVQAYLDLMWMTRDFSNCLINILSDLILNLSGVAAVFLLAERFAQLEVARPGRAVNPVPSADDRFLTRIREIIAANLEDPDFRVDALCKAIAMSRTQLHRKLTAVAGRSAGEFLRLERLNRAAEMLGAGEGNVTEVAYSVGYRSLSQFAKAFREQFGMAPSDFES